MTRDEMVELCDEAEKYMHNHPNDDTLGIFRLTSALRDAVAQLDKWEFNPTPAEVQKAFILGVEIGVSADDDLRQELRKALETKEKP